MKMNFLKNFGVTILLFVVLGFISGCGSKEKKEAKYKWDLITNKDGIVYRINKQTGEISMIAGAQAVKVEGTENSEGQTNAVVQPTLWRDFEFKDMNTKVTLKTSWRAGRLYYIFTTTPSDLLFERLRQNSPNAYFTVNFFDGDGFNILSIQVKVSEMVHYSDNSCVANGNVFFDYDTFSLIKACSILPFEFYQPASTNNAQPSTTQPGQVPDFMLQKNNPN
jgi:hypothetical protein